MDSLLRKRRMLLNQIERTFDPETMVVLQQKLYLVERDITEIRRIGKYLLEEFVDKKKER